MYLLSCTADEYVLFGDALLNVGEEVQSGAVALPRDKGAMAKFCHEGLNGFNVGLAPLEATGNALQEQFIFSEAGRLALKSQHLNTLLFNLIFYDLDAWVWLNLGAETKCLL